MKYENILILKANMKETEISEEIKRIKDYLKNHNISYSQILFHLKI